MRIFLFVWRCNLVKSKPLEHESMRAIDAKRFKINYYVIAKWIVVPIQKWWMLWREDWQFVGMSFDFKCESMLLHITINMTRTNPISFTLNDNNGRTSLVPAMSWSFAIMSRIQCDAVCAKIIFIWISLSCYLDTSTLFWPHTQTKDTVFFNNWTYAIWLRKMQMIK